MSSNCTRCGKLRIVTKTWQEQVGTSLVTYTTTTCPDPDCQKAVQGGLDKLKKQREALEKDKQQREQERLNLKRSIS
ncbi:hypothetical protein KW795_00690 [Candidatus Microgenomates bacterium]|nr:hypothetical protein [Candidatus Microgenomates bacterium]